MRSRWIFSLSVVWLGASAELVQATNSRPELEAVMRDLLAWLPGEYDTLPQVDLERRLGAPPDGEHHRQYRAFKRVEVPHIAPVGIYGEVHAAGKDSPLIPGQQVLYIVSIDEARGAVNVSGRRIKGGPESELRNQTAESLKSMQLDPEMGGNCDFLWRRHGRQIVGTLTETGKTNTTCTMTSKRSGQTMMWDAEWILNPDELWVFDNGYIMDPKDPSKPGRFFAGREDRTHERLYKARSFRCTVTDGPVKPQSVDVHDRGGEAKLASRAGKAQTLRLLRAPYPEANGVGLADRLTLDLLDEGREVPLTRREAAGDATEIALSEGLIRVSCHAAGIR